MNIGARIATSDRARARFVERLRIIGMNGIAHVEPAETRERLPVPARSRRHHAVHHVDAARDRLENIVRRADAHEISGLVGRKCGGGEVEGAQHALLPLPNRQPTDGIAVETDVDETSRRLQAEGFRYTALNDAETASARLAAEGPLRA